MALSPSTLAKRKLPPGASKQCKRCPRLILRRKGRQFCKACSKVRLPVAERRALEEGL